MKKIFLSALALIGLGTMANAQFSVYDNAGKVLFTMEETPAYVDFTYNKPTSGTENGHEWVDLGLTSGTLWATCNVGAETPDAYGDYYAWGETATKSDYNWSTYKFMDSNVNDWGGCTKYTLADGNTEGIWYDSEGKFIGDNKTELEDADDVAVQTWGGKWQMPTNAMLEELQSQCYWVWTDSYKGKSVKGYIIYKAKNASDKGVKVTSGSTPSSSYDVANDTHLFLPAAGCRWSTGLFNAGRSGDYWSRSLYAGSSDYAYGLYFYSGLVDWNGYYRYYGRSVRPVVPAAD